MNIQGYVHELRQFHASGQTTEHSFRPALARLFNSIDSALTVINDPKRIPDVGAPDNDGLLDRVGLGIQCVGLVTAIVHTLANLPLEHDGFEVL
jgi:hypothetical protein